MANTSEEIVRLLEESLDSLNEESTDPAKRAELDRQVNRELEIIKLLDLDPDEILKDIGGWILEAREHIPQDKRNKFDAKVKKLLLAHKIVFFETISREVIELSEEDKTSLSELRSHRASAEVEKRRHQLLTPDSQEELIAALMWMSARGNLEDKERIERIQPRYRSPQIHQLIEITIQEIEHREKLFEHSQPQVYNTGGQGDFVPQPPPAEPPIQAAATYRVFCPDDAGDFPQGVHVLQQYEAFVIVSAPPDAVSELRKRCPVEILEDEHDLRAASSVRSGDTAMRNMVVRFIAPVCDEWKKQIEDAGVRIVQSLDNFSILISLPSAQTLERIRRLKEVRDVYAFTPDIRVRAESLSGLDRDLEEEDSTESRLAVAEAKSFYSDLRGEAIPGLLIASFFTREYRDRAAEELSARDIEVVSRPGDKDLIVDISSTRNALNDLMIISRLEGLRVLEEKTIETWSNDVARKVLLEGTIPSNLDCIDLTGKGQIIAIADTGLDTGEEATLHPDFQGRVRLIKSYPIAESLKNEVHNPGDDDGPADSHSGHGTHVAGSAVGNGKQAKDMGLPPIQGTAPEAELIFQAIEQTPRWTDKARENFLKRYKQPPDHGIFGIPDNLKTLFEEAYENGARIHCNSWGGGKIGQYNLRCRQLDEFVWENKDFLVIVAAGNRGRQSWNNPDFIEQPSVDSPGTAKNCLTVGASENERKDLSYSYARFSERDFNKNPFYDHIVTDSIDHIAAFSSRGPCSPVPAKPDSVLRGRRKPDVVAPGTFILSTRSSRVPDSKLFFSWVQYSYAKDHYIYCSGTSMAAPLVAGCAALIRQHLCEKEGKENPSAALLKASLIHSAVYLNDPNPHPSSSKRIDNEQGWGRVNLKNILDTDKPTRVFFVDELNGLAHGKDQEYRFEVNKWDREPEKQPPLRLTLVYTDFPGEKLENNLNLFLFSPENTYYLGNHFKDKDESDSISYTEDEQKSEDKQKPQPDSMNNVEGIIVKSPIAGVWTLKVVASLIKHDTQDFALVISGDIQGDVTVVEK